MDKRLIAFAILAGLLSGVNLFLHKVAASRLEETDLAGVVRPSYIISLASNPYVYIILAMGLLVLAMDLAFLSHDVPAIVGLNFIIILGNVVFAALCVALLKEKVTPRIFLGISFGILALLLLSGS